MLALRLSGKQIKYPKALLTWKVVHEKMPWNIILLLGGGFALAKGSEVSACQYHDRNNTIWLQLQLQFGLRELEMDNRFSSRAEYLYLFFFFKANDYLTSKT